MSINIFQNFPWVFCFCSPVSETADRVWVSAKFQEMGEGCLKAFFDILENQLKKQRFFRKWVEN